MPSKRPLAGGKDNQEHPPPSPGRGGWWVWVALAVILIAGVAIRFAYLSEMKEWPEFKVPVVDAEYHRDWARSLATGDWTPPPGKPDMRITSTVYLRPPGYPFFLAGIYRLFGVNELAPTIVQMALGLLSGILAFVIGRRWFGAVAGLLWSAAVTLYWMFIYYEVQLLEPTLLIFLLLATLLLLGLWADRRTIGLALAAGLTLGVTGLVRSNVLVFLPITLLWMLLLQRRAGARRPALGHLVALAAGAVVAITPAAARNIAVSGEFALISANGGINLFIGNNEQADGFVVQQVEGIGAFGTCYDYPRLVRTLSRQVGHEMTYTEVSRYFSRRALGWITAHPIDALLLTAKKAVLFWAPYEITHNRSEVVDRAFSRVLSRMPGRFAMIAAGWFVGAAGFVLSMRRRAPGADRWRSTDAALGLLIAGFVLAYFGSYLPFFSAARYRVPVTPFLMFFAAWGLARLADLVAGKRLKEAGAWAGAAVLLFFALSVPVVPFQYDVAEWWTQRGYAFARLNDFPNAAEAYARALELRPDHPHSANTRALFAEVLLRLKRVDQAIAELQRALEVNPDQPGLHTQLGHAWMLKREPEKAVAEYERAVALDSDQRGPYVNLGNLLIGLGRYDRAIEVLQRGLVIDSQHADLYISLGNALMMNNRLDESIDQYRRALQIQPELVGARVNLGIALRNKGRLDEAMTEYRQVLAATPNDPQLHHNMAITLEDLGQNEEAVRHYAEALRFEPRSKGSSIRLAQLLLKMGRADEAVRVLKAALDLQPDAADVRQALEDARRQAGG